MIWEMSRKLISIPNNDLLDTVKCCKHLDWEVKNNNLNPHSSSCQCALPEIRLDAQKPFQFFWIRSTICHFRNSVIKSRIKPSFHRFNTSHFFDKCQELNGAYKITCFFYFQNCYAKIIFDCIWKFSKMNTSLISLVVGFPLSVFPQKYFV